MEGNDKKYTLEELESELSKQHKDFCHRWIIDYNNVQSYLHVYPNSSYDSACVSAYDLLRKPKIKQYIDFIKEDIAKEAQISKLGLINELKLIAFSNITEIIKKIKKQGLESLTEEEQKCITEYSEGINGFKIKSDKRGAIQDIMKAMGWNEADKIDLSSTDGSMRPRQVNIQYNGKDIDLSI